MVMRCPLESSFLKNELHINKDVDNQDAKADQEKKRQQKIILPTDIFSPFCVALLFLSMKGMIRYSVMQKYVFPLLIKLSLRTVDQASYKYYLGP
jgi:hypothetical protein